MPRPRAQEKEQAIVVAATQLFLEHGFNGATIKDIAERADVSVGTVYVYFEDKIAIVRRVAYAFAEQHAELAKKALSQTRKPLGKLKRYLLGLYDMWRPFGTNELGPLELAAAVIEFAPDTLEIAKNEFLNTVETILTEARKGGHNVKNPKTEAMWIAIATSSFYPLAGTPSEHPFTSNLTREDLEGLINWIGHGLRPA